MYTNISVFCEVNNESFIQEVVTEVVRMLWLFIFKWIFPSDLSLQQMAVFDSHVSVYRRLQSGLRRRRKWIEVKSKKILPRRNSFIIFG